MRSRMTKAFQEIQKVLDLKLNLIVYAEYQGSEVEWLLIDKDFKQGSSDKIVGGLPDSDTNDETGIGFYLNRLSEKYDMRFTMDDTTNDHWIIVKKED